MDILKLFFFLFLFSSLVQSKKHCPTSYCNNNKSLPIQYPFKLQDHQPDENCSYTNLRCNDQGTPVLNLSSSGEFLVRNIDYYYSIIQLYDPDNCLPKRFMSLNILYQDGPFFSTYDYRNYTFYSCPSELIRLANVTSVDCLSNSSTATVATRSVSGEVMKKLYRCNEIVTSLIPVSWLEFNDDFIGNQSDFFLRWIGPACGNCQRATGMVPDSVFITAVIIIYFLPFIMAPLICLGCCVQCIGLFFIKEVGAKNSNVA